MPDYRREREYGAHPDRLYNYLADVRNLPEYFTQMISAHKTGPHEVHTSAQLELPGQRPRTVEGAAWFRTDKQERKVEWGSEGDSDYRGRLRVSDCGASGSLVELEIHSEASRPGIEEGIDSTLDNIARATS